MTRYTILSVRSRWPHYYERDTKDWNGGREKPCNSPHYHDRPNVSFL